MRGLFGSSPHRVRNASSHDSNDSSRGDIKQRPSFAFMKYSPDRRSSASMKASREHARQIARQLSINEPEAAPTSFSKRKARSAGAPRQPGATFQPAFPELSAFDDFNPFGHDGTITSSFSIDPVIKAPPQHPPPPRPQEDFFAQPSKPVNYQRRPSSNRSITNNAPGANFPMRENSFESESVSSSAAYDMDFLAMQTLQRDTVQTRRSSAQGRPPRNRGPSSDASFASTSTTQWSQSQQPPSTPPLASMGPSPSKSMSTFPANSSMQSSYALQTSTPPTKAVSMTPPMSSGGAAARRRMRSQMRQGSSGASLQGSDTCSFDGTPPASPSSVRNRQVMSSNGSVGSNSGARNRVANYTSSGGGNWQNSPSTSMRGGASVCSSTADSDIDLFETQNENGGFTFDAFGLDASEIDREVQQAIQAIAGTSVGGFGALVGMTNNTSNTSIVGKPQDLSMDEFEPQVWDSPPGSRRSTPIPKDQEEDDGFVDGFRVSKPSPLPLISVHRQSPTASERSSSVSSITDNNTDHGVPRRNVFKEKAGFTSSSSHGRPSPGQGPKKKWVPPPGAVKILTPPRHEVSQQRQSRQRQQQQQSAQALAHCSTEVDTDKYWQEQLNEIPNMLNVEQQPAQFAQKQQSSQSSTANKWQSGAANFHSPTPNQVQSQNVFDRDSSRRKAEEEKKDGEFSEEDRDNHTATTSAMTTVVSDSQASSVRHQPASKAPASKQQPRPKLTPSKGAKRDTLERLETKLSAGNGIGELQGKTLSPQEQRKKDLEELRNGSNSASPPGVGFQPQIHLHQACNNVNQLKPQQERANECTDQRTSLASLRERLKSPTEHDLPSRSPLTIMPQGSSHRAQSLQSVGSKSEIGVSSFTRQKMKISSLSSSASKSEVNFSKSPRNSQHRPEVTAALNRIRGMSRSGSSPSATRFAQSSGYPSPAFGEHQLRKTSSSVLESAERVEELEEQEAHNQRYTQQPRGSPRHVIQQSFSQQHHKNSLSQEYPPRGSPQSQLQHTYSQDSPMLGTDRSTESSAPKQPTYRERRELELAKEREATEKASKSNETEKRDVASLIRRRIAANKTKANSPTSTTTDDSESQQPVALGRDRLRPTGRSTDEQGQSTSSGEYDRRSPFEPYDELCSDGVDRQGFKESQDYKSLPEQRISSHMHSDHEKAPASGSEASDAYLLRKESATVSVGGVQHAEINLNQFKAGHPQRPKQSVSAGGLSALHDQLKQLQIQPPDDEERSNGSAREPEMLNIRKAAPKRIQAIVEGRSNFEKLEITTANSQSSDQHTSPTRTPKATYAMLNAFLHGRDTVVAPDETPARNNDEEEMPSGSPPKVGQPSMLQDARPALKDDPKYSRYFTMLKIGMPLDVVKHAMIRDNLDPAVMDGDHNKPACIGIPLKEDPKYAKYFKMLKIGMPMEAVKHAMERDGLDSHIMDQDHHLPVDTTKGKQDEGPKEKDSHRRARLHWKPLREVRRNSLWAKIDEDPELDNIEIDEKEFAELFQAELQTDAEKSRQGNRIKSPRKGAAVRVIDPKRANNGGIILARLKMSHDDMADVVDRIDENCMTAEQIEHIIEYLPTREERKALETYMLEGGQDAAEKFDGLCECEKFMVSMMTVKHAKRKVRALLFKLQFESCLEALYQETHVVDSSCDELSNSVRLRQLLGIVLTFGNRLNTAGKGKKKKAGAFTLDSLLKLNQAKAFDKKTTFLQYIVLIVQRNNELLLRFRDDLPTVFKADKTFWDQCISDLEEVENQLENVRRIALYQAKQAAKFRRKKKKHHEGEDDEESLTDLSLSLEEEVEALRATPIGLFTLSAIKKVSFLRDRVEGTKVKFNQLLEYFGEDEKRMQPHELFNIIVKFCGDFSKATEQVMADEKIKKREERKRQNSGTANLQTPSKTPTQTPNQRPHTGMMLKLSAMQPNASRLIEDIKRGNAPTPQKNPTPPERQTTPQTRNPVHQGLETIADSAPQHGSHQSSQSPKRQEQDRSHQNRPVQQRESSPVAQLPLSGPQVRDRSGDSRPYQGNHPTSQMQLERRHDQDPHLSNRPVQRRESVHVQHNFSSNQRANETRDSFAPPSSQGHSVGIPLQASSLLFQPTQGSSSLRYEHQDCNSMDVPAGQVGDTTVRGREASRIRRPSDHRERSTHDNNRRPPSQHLGIDCQSLALDDVIVIPPGMQDKGRLEASYGSQQVLDDQTLNPAGSTESQTSTLRQKARIRGRNRTSNSPPEDPPAHTMTQQRNVVPHMHRQASAPFVGSHQGVDHGVDRRPSLRENSSVAEVTRQASNTPTSSMMRNKLRSKRMQERKQRVLGRTS